MYYSNKFSHSCWECKGCKTTQVTVLRYRIVGRCKVRFFNVNPFKVCNWFKRAEQDQDVINICTSLKGDSYDTT